MCIRITLIINISLRLSIDLRCYLSLLLISAVRLDLVLSIVAIWGNSTQVKAWWHVHVHVHFCHLRKVLVVLGSSVFLILNWWNSLLFLTTKEDWGFLIGLVKFLDSLISHELVSSDRPLNMLIDMVQTWIAYLRFWFDTTYV